MKDYADRFCAKFGIAPTVRVVAPGRVNLIGEHIDYLDGWVMPAAIEPHLTFLAAPGSDSGNIEVWAEDISDEIGQVSTSDFAKRTAPDEKWLNYIIGVAALYAKAEFPIQNCRVAIFSTLPAGAGLSSSAAVETATALLIEHFAGRSVSVTERAEICQKAEQIWAGVPCGIMDQLSVGAGQEDHVVKIDCLDNSVEPIPLPKGISLVIADSGVKHSHGEGEYGKRRADCEEALATIGGDSWRNVTMQEVDNHREQLGDRLYRRSRHAVTEIQRVIDFTEALQNGDLTAIYHLMKAGHESLRDDYEVSCPELDFLVEAGYRFGEGQIGSRMTGGGFGGSSIHLVRDDAAGKFINYLQEEYRNHYNRQLDCFTTRAMDGAHCESIS